MTNLGRIASVALEGRKTTFGLFISLTGRDWGTVDTSICCINSFSNPLRPGISVNSQEDVDKSFMTVSKAIAELLHKAKKTNINDLIGVPVEVTIENRTLVSWRVLEEVL